MNQRRSYDKAKSGFFSMPLCLCGEFLLTVLALFAFTDCSSKAEPRKSAAPAAPAIKAAMDIFDNFMNAGTPPAAGFDLPVGDGLRITRQFLEPASSHAGEDWGFADRADGARGEKVYAIANGRVISASIDGKEFLNTIIIEHTYYENNEKLTINSFYANLGEMKVKEGDIVQRHQLIATIGQCDEDGSGPHLHIQLRRNKYTTADEPTDGNMDHARAWIEKHFVPPTQFINDHRNLFVPQQEPTLVLVDQTSYRMRLYHNGNMQGEYNVSFGQNEGQKRAQGDNKTPKGMYFIVQKHRGNDFPGPYGGYYGKHWMKINYPNKYDAAWGRSQGVITPKQEATITASWQKRSGTLENTGLGGGIGFHGWIKEWDNRGPRHLSWGCVVMHISDVTQLFDQMPEGSMVVIF